LENRATTLAVAAGCVVLTLIFLIIGFPYHRLESRVVRAIETAIDGRMTYAEAEQVFTFAGPGYEWRSVRITGATPRPLDFELFRARPAWSLAWLRLSPAFHVELEGTPQRAVGVITLGSRPGFDGQLEQFELSDLPTRLQPKAFALRGIADADIDLTGGEHLIGDVEIAVANGTLSGEKLRTGLPFTELTGALQMVGDNRTEISSLHIVSPLLKADLVGTIGPGPSFGEAPLDLALELDANARATQVLRAFGIRLSRQGAQSLKVSGTVNAPKVR
jgi:type II secretion system protein N